LFPLPHQARLDLGASKNVTGFSYTPRQDGKVNGNIGTYGLETSTDNATWTVVANGTWVDDQSTKVVSFTARTIRYFRLTGFTEAGNRGAWYVVYELSFFVSFGNISAS
jgi:hypothetical protein